MAPRPSRAGAAADTEEPGRSRCVPPRQPHAAVPGRGSQPAALPLSATAISFPAAGLASAHLPGPTSLPPEPVLLVAACAGPRCRGLRALHDPSAAASGPCGQLLAATVRRRPGAVLLSTGCLGPCERGCVAAVGWAVSASGRLCWAGRPVGLGMVEISPRAAALAAWITGTAPDPATLPEPLWRIGAT